MRNDGKRQAAKLAFAEKVLLIPEGQSGLFLFDGKRISVTVEDVGQAKGIKPTKVWVDELPGEAGAGIEGDEHVSPTFLEERK